jgi:ParB family chromosome partitioning protein
MVGQDKKRALGRGLSALLPAAAPPVSHAAAQAESPRGGGVLRLPVEAIRRDGRNPRKRFDEQRLRELADSIKAQGVLQPVLVRREGSGYRLIAGERRWRAAQLAGLKDIPAILREASEKEAFELALVENLQRADLDPIEEARGFQQLMEEFKLTQEQVSQRVGRDRSSVANALRLLALPEAVKEMLQDGSLSMGHARALLGVPKIPELVALAKRVADGELSVRETESLVKERRDGKPGSDTKKKVTTSQAARNVVEDLQRRLGTKVRLKDRGGKGTLELDYFSYADLERICQLIHNRR